MNCSEFETELEQLVETRVSTISDHASSHLSQCADCRQRWANHLLIESALVVWRQTPQLPSMAEALIQQLRIEQFAQQASTSAVRPTAIGTGRSWPALIVAAACLFLVLGLGTVSRLDTRNPTANNQRNTPSHPTQMQTAEPSEIGVASSVAAVLDDLRAEYQELAAETSATARDFAVVLPPASLSPWPDAGMKATGEQPRDPEVAAGQASAGTVSALGRSIGTQISQAIDFLWVAVPESVPRG